MCCGPHLLTQLSMLRCYAYVFVFLILWGRLVRRSHLVGVIRSHSRYTPSRPPVREDLPKAAIPLAPAVARPTTLMAAGLPPTDTKTDVHYIHFFLDECCNICCHLAAFAARAKLVYEAHGRKIGALIGEARNFKGLGTRDSAGSKALPFSMRFLDKSDKGDYCAGEVH